MTTRRKLLIWGGTGQALVLNEFIRNLAWEIAAVGDRNRDLPSPFPQLPLFHELSELDGYLKENGGPADWGFLVAIGGEHGEDRTSISRELEALGLIAAEAIHPEAYIASDAELGKGVQVMAKAVVCAAAKVGDFCLINTAASVDHESRLGTGVHIGPGARLAGCVEVEDYAFVGIGAIVLPRLKIGRRAVVGAGAVVTHDVPENTVVCGNPARPLKER